MNRIKSILFGLTAFFLVIFICVFVVGEVIFRIVKPLARPLSMGISMGRPDPVFHHLYPPNIRVKEMFAGFETSFSTNSQGLRGKDPSIAKPDGTYRILVFGDSFVFGTAVNDNQTFCRLLEESLNAAATGRRYEVINCGIVSYSPILEYLLLKEKMIAYSPDLVMLFYNFSDLQEDTVYARHARYDKDGEIIACNPFYIDNHPDYLLLLQKRFHFFSFIYNKLSKSFNKMRILGFKKYLLSRPRGKSAKELIMQKPTIRSVEQDAFFIFRENTDAKVIDYYWKNSSAWLDKFKVYLSDRGVDFILVSFPLGHQISKDAWREGRKAWFLEEAKLYDSEAPFEMLASYARKRKIDFVNLRPYLAAHMEEELYYSFDGHWTAQGHKRVAEGLLNDPLFSSMISRSRQSGE